MSRSWARKQIDNDNDNDELVNKRSKCFIVVVGCSGGGLAANLRTETLDFRGSDPSRILILRGGILRSLADFPDIVSQRILVWRILVGRLTARERPRRQADTFLSERSGRAPAIDPTVRFENC